MLSVRFCRLVLHVSVRVYMCLPVNGGGEGLGFRIPFRGYNLGLDGLGDYTGFDGLDFSFFDFFFDYDFFGDLEDTIGSDLYFDGTGANSFTGGLGGLGLFDTGFFGGGIRFDLFFGYYYTTYYKDYCYCDYYYECTRFFFCYLCGFEGFWCYGDFWLFGRDYSFFEYRFVFLRWVF